MMIVVFLLMATILQWNAQSIIAHGNELKNALNNWDKKQILYVYKRPG